MNRVKTVTDYNGETISYGYDQLGRRMYIEYPGGKKVRYEYYKNGNLKTVADADGNVTYYEYDADGNLSRTERADGSQEEYYYNEMGLLTGQTDQAADGSILHEYRYTYDANGNITQVKGNETPDADLLNTASMKYDRENRLTEYNGEAVTYDECGNMIHGPLNGKMADYAYDCRNRLIKVMDADGSVTEYEYDAENIRTAQVKDGQKTVYTVDREAQYSQTLKAVTYSKNLLGQYAKKEAESLYVYGAGLVSEKKGEETLYYHYNHIGSTTEITGQDGETVYRFRYGAYGELTDLLDGDGESLIVAEDGKTLSQSMTEAIGETGISFLYNGQYGVMTDTDGLYYMRARYYNTEIKRFINRDVVDGSIDNGQSLNKYCYVQGNPVSLTDPFGLCPIGDKDSGFARFIHTIKMTAKELATGLIPVYGAAVMAKEARECWKNHDYYNALRCGVGVIANVALTAGVVCLGASLVAGAAASACASSAVAAASAVASLTGTIASYTGFAAVAGSFGLTSYSVAKTGYQFGNVISQAIDDYAETGSVTDATKQRLGETGAEFGKTFAFGLVEAGIADSIYGGKTLSDLKVDVTGQFKAGCFIAGTKIQTAEGEKNIEDIRVGDKVYAYDPETGENGIKEVQKTFVHDVTELLHVTVNGETIHTTPNHPFYVEGTGFVRADELKVGDRVRLLNGKIKKVDKLEAESLKEPVKVFNFKVADWHDYYVGTQGVLVHNADNSCSVTEGGSGSRTVGNNQSTVYRVIRSDENPLNGLSAKNPTRGMSIEGHIVSGSRNNGSQYISTTTDINVAQRYATKEGCKIVEIDLNKISSDVPIYDLSTDLGRNTYLRGNTAKNFAKSSSEVLIEGYIPSEAIKLH